MRANLLASVASAAVAAFLTLGSAQAQSDDELKRKQNVPAAEETGQSLPRQAPLTTDPPTAAP